MNEPTISFVGNLTADPELKWTPTGKAVANVAVACNPRRYDATAATWIDGTPVFWQCEAWGSLGENTAETLRKGDRVVVTGHVKAYTWTPTDGEHAGVEQRRIQIVVEELGASLRFVTANLTKADRPTQGAAGRPPANRRSDRRRTALRTAFERPPGRPGHRAPAGRNHANSAGRSAPRLLPGRYPRPCHQDRHCGQKPSTTAAQPNAIATTPTAQVGASTARASRMHSPAKTRPATTPDNPRTRNPTPPPFQPSPRRRISREAADTGCR